MIYVDSDACPVKSEVMRVATRHQLEVVFVANSWMRLPEDWNAKLMIVENQLDAADDWIVEQLKINDVVITADIPLVDRAIKAGARVINPHGKVYSADNIGSILATRDLLTSLRNAGEITGGPAPFKKEDRSYFLQELEKILQEIKRNS
jgi:uncharacterized protein YaiI (UPF0178 family)